MQTTRFLWINFLQTYIKFVAVFKNNKPNLLEMTVNFFNFYDAKSGSNENPNKLALHVGGRFLTASFTL
jgi:hypothetical protein